jgi:micrococcal nuclease
MYEYRCTVKRVVDGDTIDLDIDLGLRVHVHARVRLLNVDTPEVYGVKKGSEEHAAGMIASEFTKAWVAEHGPKFTIATHRDRTGKYGRWLVELLTDDGISLNEALVEKGWG